MNIWGGRTDDRKKEEREESRNAYLSCLNEEDRLQIARLLIKAGYSVRIGYQVIPGNAKGKKEYVIEYWEEEA